MNDNYIQIQNLVKEFDQGEIKALRGVNLVINRDEFIAIMGPSGCGKSTLLHMLGALDKPTSGEILIENKKLSDYKDLADYRSQKVGFIFQMHNLIPSLTALENVQIPIMNTKLGLAKRKEKAQQLLQLVGLHQRDNNLPTRLSGGERQKVAIARALANDPEIIIADEPTGNLDSESTKNVMNLLKKIHVDRNVTIILVTHDLHVAQFADKTIQMLDGKII